MFVHEVTEQIKMKLLEVRHAEEIYETVDRQREYLGKFLPWVSFTHSSADIKTYIEGELKKFIEGNGFSSGIFAEGKFVGIISINEINWQHQRASIGYWLSADYQGKGAMTACCKALVNHCFHELGLNKVEIRARMDNPKSQAIPERLGFKLHGILLEQEYENGHFYDNYVYGVLRRDWTY